MSIRQLSLTDFRNLQSSTLDFHPSLNLITGDNGSGKTSLLEAIHILCQGRSFRHHQLKKSIQHGKESFLLFGRFSDYKTGLSKSEKNLEIRLNGETLARRSLLAIQTPVNIVNANSFELITGSPEQRRQYLDWCMFHVEPKYTEYWSQFRHALKQRNKLLKSKQDLQLLDYWNDYLIQPSMALHELRSNYCQIISDLLANEISDLLTGMSISLKYQQGWKQNTSLLQSLKTNRDRDIRSGFTNSGIHRDDLVILANAEPAADVLSRGQLKRLSLALLMASLRVVKAKSHRPIILLIDDLHAEMDKTSQKKTYEELLEMDLQLFITNIEASIPEPIKSKDFKWFHVEHGMIKSRKPNQ